MYTTVHMSPLLTQERLPRCVIPEKYHLKIYVFTTKETFDGIVKITVNCLEATNNILLHADRDLEIKTEDIIITNFTSTNLKILNISRNRDTNLLTIEVSEKLQKNSSYEIEIAFKGNFSISTKEPSGGFFFESNFDYVNDISVNAAVTNLFPNFTCRMFPCFDEPSFKATFQLIVGHTPDMTAISVTPLHHSEQDESRNGWILDHFTVTPPIPPFSIGLLVSNYRSTDPEIIKTSLGEFVLQWHGPPSNILNITKRTTEIVPNVLKYLTEFFGIAYPLPKLDIGFSLTASGINETNSFGLLTLRECFYGNRMSEWDLLILPNLWLHHVITPEWWSEFTAVEYLSAFLIRTAYIKLSDSSSPNSITEEKSDYNEMELYLEQGKWFFRMLFFVLSENTCKEGLKNLISENIYRTYTKTMLWNALTQAAHAAGTLPESLGVDVIANSWLRIDNDNDHFPVLRVCRNYSENSALLEQEMFVEDKDDKLTEEDKKRVWWLPIIYITQEKLDADSAEVFAWMGEKQLIISNLPNSESFIIVNPTHVGMFLVNYDNHNWELISQFLIATPTLVPGLTRKKLLHDALLLNSVGQLNYNNALNITLLLLNENINPIWTPFFSWIKDLIDKCQKTSIEDKLKLYVRYLMSSIKEACTLDDDFRSRLLRAMSGSDRDIIIGNATEILNKVDYQEKVDKDEKEVQMEMSTSTLYDEDSQICLELLNKSKTYSSYEWHIFVNSLTSSHGTHRTSFYFFLEHFAELRRKFFFFKDMWKPLISAIMNNVSTEEDFKEMLKFREEHKVKLGYSLKIVDKAIETAKRNIEWIKTNIPEINNWLDSIVPQLKKLQQGDENDKSNYCKVQPVFLS